MPCNALPSIEDVHHQQRLLAAAEIRPELGDNTAFCSQSDKSSLASFETFLVVAEGKIQDNKGCNGCARGESSPPIKVPLFPECRDPELLLAKGSLP
jgi:hypothetical protein